MVAARRGEAEVGRLGGRVVRACTPSTAARGSGRRSSTRRRTGRVGAISGGSRCTSSTRTADGSWRRAGQRLVRFFWRMEIELDEPPPEPAAPAGHQLRPYRPGDDDAQLHAVHQEAFAEHWELTPQPLEEWLHGRIARSDYDPAFWRLAVAGERSPGQGSASESGTSAGSSISPCRRATPAGDSAWRSSSRPSAPSRGER